MRHCRAVLLVLVATASAAETTVVHTPAEFAAVTRNVRPGDTVMLADGVWRDFEIQFSGSGTADKPIALTGQTPGRVIISGRSNLRMSGQHLLVSNLVFRDGHSPTGEVISFRRNRSERAVHSRITGVVIDGFNKPDRNESDHWVALYGHHNRFDHNQLAGKNNAGATLVVVRDTEQGLENRHRIDHNFFGPRPNLGSNGGETLRVGTSHDSLSDSHTLVERNWFEHCDGEVEIVSNKSGANIYRGNVFFESQGALVLRHGDGNLVEDNVFFGNGKPHTGGVRVINRRQTVRNNYMEGLAGEGFASALTVMYGVPDSPLNRYVQVEEAAIEHNTIIDAVSVFLGAGRDQERSAPPIRSRLSHTLIVNAADRDPLRIDGHLPGLQLIDNVQSGSGPVRPGFRKEHVALERNAHGLLIPNDLERIGARRDLQPLSRADTGVAWYPKNRTQTRLDSGREIAVAPGDQTLTSAVLTSAPGDRLQLAAGHYSVDQILTVAHPLTVAGPPGGAHISFSRPALFEIGRGGSLHLTNLTVSGTDAPDSAGNAAIRTREGSGAIGYELLIEDSRFVGLKTNRAFDVFAAAKGTMADRISLRRVTVADISGDVIAADAETDDLGTYNVERLEIADSVFRDIGGAVVNLYRGGTDESTFGPRLTMTGSLLERVGRSKMNPTRASLRLHGVQNAAVRDSRIVDSAGVRFIRTVGEPVWIAERLTLSGTPAPAISGTPAPAIETLQ